MIRELSGSKWAGLLVTFTTVTFILMAAEIGLRNFLVTSEYVNPLMELEWRKKYWIPINEEKYRDYPIPRNVPPGTKRIVIVGDSFASGTGISRIKDTFPQILAQRLGKGFTVNIVARPGMDTTQEWVSLKAFPVKPDILILSYVYNDIDYLITKSDFRAHPSAPVIFLIKRTYVANILYRHGWSDIVYLEKYHHALISAYNNPELWKRQEKWLNRFVNYAAGMKCRLIVIVWPILGDSKEYAIPLQKVAEFFLKRNVIVVDLISPLGEHTGTEMAVSRFNSHPNERAHRIAAQALYDTIVNSQ